MYKVIHNTEESFAQEVVKSALPIRIGLWSKSSKHFVYFYIKATAIVEGVIHEILIPITAVPALLVERKKEAILSDFRKLSQEIGEFLKKKGAKEVKVGSFYEAHEA